MSKPSCLVVEDEPGIGWAMRRLLEQAGARVIVAANGTSALEHLGKESVSAIFLDVKLPDADGFELAEVINRMTPATPIAIISAYFYPNDPKVRQMLDRGIARRFIAKPFRHEEVRRAWRDLLAPQAPWKASHSLKTTTSRNATRTSARHRQDSSTCPQ